MIRPQQLNPDQIQQLASLEKQLNEQYSAETDDEVVLVALSKRDGRVLGNTLEFDQT